MRHKPSFYKTVEGAMRNFTKIFMCIVNVIFLCTILAWPVALYLSFFLFDAPGSKNNLLLACLACAMVTYPAPILAANILFFPKVKTSTKKQQIGGTTG